MPRRKRSLGRLRLDLIALICAPEKLREQPVAAMRKPSFPGPQTADLRVRNPKIAGS
jgi:hypothetical protein